MIEGKVLRYAEVRALLAADRAHLELLMADLDPWRIRQAWWAVMLYRWSQYHYGRGRRTLGRLLWQLNLALTGADINPISDFGPGLVVPNPMGVTLFGVAGEKLIAHAQTVIGGGRSRKDVGAGPGRPVLGNQVVLHHGALVLGPVRIGDAAEIGPGCVVMEDVAAKVHLRVQSPQPETRKGEHG